MDINLLNSFEETVAQKKDLVAVIHNEEKITFENLMIKAKNVAINIINETNNCTNIPIAVFLPKEINAIIADLAIMYSCNPFMNLDIKTPVERIANIISLIKPCVVITSQKYSQFFLNIDIKILLIENLLESSQNFECIIENKRKMMIDTDPLCIINTSGSTGTPKGVVLNHRSFFDFIKWSIETFNFDGSEIIGSLSPVVFDIFDFELCMLMVCGSEIVLLDSTLALFPARLLESINKNHINFIFWVPSIMVNIANMDLLKKIDVSGLKTIWFAGEVFPTKQFLYWYDNLPNSKFVNLYGPIEITLDCTYHVITERPAETEPLPIGIPCRNTDILIVNENDKLCEENEEGELCVRGTSLAMGYYNNPEKTSITFTQNPLNSSYPEIIYRTGDVVFRDTNGIIHFKGRKDSLIKHMGYRIELGEIEHVLINELKIVKYCCAVYNYSKKEIVLFYEKDEDISVIEFRSSLKAFFPSYMIPSKYERMSTLPRNTNGKIDRLKLKNLINS